MTEERAKLPKILIEREKLSKAELEKRKEKQIKISTSTDAGAYTLHVYRVFNDPAFHSEIKALRSKLEELYYKDISLTTSFGDDHLLKVDKHLIKLVADKYCISFEDLGIYADGMFDNGSVTFGKPISEYGGLEYGSMNENHLLCYVIGSKTTLEQIVEDWPFIREMRRVVYGYIGGLSINIKTKSKSPENPDLIYAIFQARNSTPKKKFSKIFKEYQDGDLYDGQRSSNQFISKDSLERHYRKHKPAQKNTSLYNELYEANKKMHYEKYIAENLKTDT